MFIKKIIKTIWAKRNARKSELRIIENNKFNFKLSSKEKRFCRNNGFSYSEYVAYRANGDDICKYISTLDSYLPRKHNGDLMAISDNKLLFPYLFSNYFKVAKNYACIIGGEIFPLDGSGLNKDTIFDFLGKSELILKPYNGCDGKGIYKLGYCGETDNFCINNESVSRQDILNKVQELDKYVLQEKLTQHTFFSELYPESVNTIRIISARTGKSYKHEILCAVQRIGSKQSAPADNFSKGGFSAKIDINTGKLSKITSAASIDNNGKRIYYSEHPDTKRKIEGEVVPKWEEIKRAVMEFSEKFPLFNYIAWDLCLDENGDIMLIETNMKSSLDVFQVHGGLKDTALGKVLQGYKGKKQ